MKSEPIQLTEEQQAEAERIEDLLTAKARVEMRQVARLLASKENHELLGKTAFQVRNACHRVGAAGIDAALEQRKKGGPRIGGDVSALPPTDPVPGISGQDDHQFDGTDPLRTRV